ncbi:MAG TPA: glycosyltransferase family 4 protein [Opitutaceae bacterium]|nr:glycosyltransferase family 4 protein [Opitutaceae bacterium]
MAIHGFALGGMEEHAVDLACGLAARGHHVTMLLPHKGGGPLAPLAPRLMAAGVRVETRRLLDLERFGDRVAARWSLVRWMRRQRFDVLHLHRYNPYHSHALPALAALAGVRQRFVSEQDPGLQFGTPKRLIAAFGDSFVTRWIVASSFSERAIHANTRRSPARVSRVALGIPTERFPETSPEMRAAARASLGIAPDAFAIGTVCRLVTLKGIDDLLAAAPGMLARFPKAEFLIAGGGPESERLVAAGKIVGERVRFLGRVESTSDFLAALDVFAFPSRYEGFGLAVAEAMATGLPVVGTRVGAVEEMLTESGGGAVVPANDPAAFAAALEQFATSTEARSHAGMAGRRYALRELSLPAMIDRFEAVYASPGGAA